MGAKLNYIIFGTSLVLGVVLRVCMLLFTVETSSGFIEHDHMTAAVLIILLMLVAAILVFVSATGWKKACGIRFAPLLTSVTNIALAVAIFYEVLISSLLSYAPPVQSIMHKASGVLAAAALLYMAVCYFIRLEYPKIITIFPIVFWITRVITVFSEFAALATVSDTVIETAAMCLCLFVFMDSGKLECGLSVKSTRLTRAVSALCGYVCLISSLPRIIVLFTAPAAFTYFSNIPPYTTLAAGLVSIAFALRTE